MPSSCVQTLSKDVSPPKKAVPVYAIKVNGATKVQLHFLTSALAGGE